MLNGDIIEKNKAHFDSVWRKFKSANNTSVERASLTREEVVGAFHHWLYRLCGGTRTENAEKEFDAWLNDPFTHWISDTDAAWQAWQERQSEIDFLVAKVKLLEGN